MPRHRRVLTLRRVLYRTAALLVLALAGLLWLAAGYTVALSAPAGAAVAVACASAITYLGCGLYRLGGRS